MARRNNKDRGLFQRGGSKIWWTRYAGPNGRIIRESTNTTVKKLAREILSKRKTLVAENRHLDVKKIPKTTFQELCDLYWEEEGSLRKTKGLASMLKIWKEYFGNPLVSELTAQKIEAFLRQHTKAVKLDGMTARVEVAPATKNRHLALLSRMFNKGIERGRVVENPAQGVEKYEENNARTRYLSTGEIERLLEASSDDFRPVLITALHTGMRRGEILNLQWPDVDLKARVILIRESKSGKQRKIPMDETLYETLSVLPSRFKKGYVFPSPRTGGRRYDFKKPFRAAVTKAGIEDFRFHDLRHTFGSHLVMNGVDLRTIQELLGHYSVSMTEKYAHLAPDHRTRAVKTLDTAYLTDTKTDTPNISGGSQSA